MLWFAALILIIVAINRFYLSGEDLRRYDSPRPAPFDADRKPSAEHSMAILELAEMIGGLDQLPRRQQLHTLRERMDAFGAGLPFDGEIVPVETVPVETVPVESAAPRGEWVIAAGADTARRLLYIHGGAWFAGSPCSHRAITTEYSTRLGAAVFALDYRLLPEHSRQDGIDDCRQAWLWVRDNGPAGPSAATDLYLSGDSAGGNLTLALTAWIRDRGGRQPNAAVALSPATDATFTSPSMKSNIKTDHMLGPMFGKLGRIPKWILRWMALFNHRIRPSHPGVSPVFGDLHGLPPTLLHVSTAEMLLDDAVRYVNKARSQGSPVILQAWNDMLHVWHLFVRDVPEAREAFEEIETFLNAHRSLNAADSDVPTGATA